jgi:hypothetical protein
MCRLFKIMQVPRGDGRHTVMSTTIVNCQLDAQFFYYYYYYYYLIFIIHLLYPYVFRALLCSTSGGQGSPLLAGALSSHLQRVTIPDAVLIQFDLLRMSIIVLETCRGI